MQKFNVELENIIIKKRPPHSYEQFRPFCDKSFQGKYVLYNSEEEKRRFSLKFWKKQEDEEDTPPANEIVRYRPNITKGLTKLQVAERISHRLVNNTRVKTSKSYGSIFYKNIFTFFNMIWLVLAVALLLCGAFKDMTFVFVVVANTAVAIIQEIRAKITVEKLSIQTSPQVKVVREGQEVDLPSSQLVLDDIIILSNGSQVPADCIILDGKIEVNESLLTGESNARVRTKGDKLLSGSFLISGQCYARVDSVGKNNYMSQIAARAREFKAPQSSLFKDINRLIRYIGIAIIPIGILTFLKEFNIEGATIQDAIKSTCGSLSSMIPAGMFLLITVALAVGVIKLSKKNTLVRDIYSVEMLARTNILCLDKTGTITDGTMNVVDFAVYSKRRKSTIKTLISNILYNQKAVNSTSNALIKEFGINEERVAVNHLEFSSERKYSVTQLSEKEIYFLGAPSFIGCKLSSEQQEFIDKKTRQGLRVIALTELNNEKFSDDIKGTNSTVIALIVLEEHIRKDSRETIQWFKDNGVEIKIISGDDAATVAKIAERVGVDGADKYVSLENVSLAEIEQMASEFTVFGRVTPEQKYSLIKALKNKGKVVSMTGDGVNDTLALKEADCSIAMADGSEIARNISKIVLLNSDFTTLPDIVKEGRQVVNNVQNSSALYLMKTLFAITLSVITLILGLSYPFTPIMMVPLECFIIGLASVIMTFEPNTRQIRGNFIPQVLKRATPRALLMLVNILVVVLLAGKAEAGLTSAELNTLCVLVLSYTGLINLVSLCWKPTPVRWIAIVLSTVSLVGATIIMPEFFEMTMFTPTVLITFGAIMLASILIVIALKLNNRHIDNLKQKTINILQKEVE